MFSLSKNSFRYFSTSIQKRQRKSNELANKTEKLKNEQKRGSVKFKTSIPRTIISKMFIVVRNSREPPHAVTVREYGFERMNEVNWIIGKEMEFHIYKLSNQDEKEVKICVLTFEKEVSAEPWLGSTNLRI